MQLVKQNSESINRQAQTLSDLIADFIANIDASETTRKVYAQGAKHFTQWIQANGIDTPTKADIIAYKDYLSRNYSVSTANVRISAVRAFFNFMEEKELYPNIAANIKNIKDAHRHHKKDALSADSAKSLLATAKGETLGAKRDFAIISLMLHTGLRTIEVARANICDMRLKQGYTVLWIQGKGHSQKDDFVKLTSSVYTAINDYLQARACTNDEAPLFASVANRNFGERMTTNSISRLVKGHLRNTGFDSDRLTAHSLRHTAATVAVQSGVEMRTIQQMTRHANISTLEVYLNDEKRLKDSAEDALEVALAM